LASDVFYDTESTEHVTKLTAHLFGDGDSVLRRAFIVDPANRPNQDTFIESSNRNEAEADLFPGQGAEFVLINVTPQKE
jgi:hypothetical protein